MEKATPIGLATGLAVIYGVIFMGAGWMTFFDPSLFLVVAGTVAALLVNYSLDEFKRIPSALKGFFSFKAPDLHVYVQQFTELSRVARSEGLLALDRRLGEMEDEFMRFGLEMAVDGMDEEAVDSLMRQRLREEARKSLFPSKFFTNAGTYAPAFGMIGTLIGLIQMLQNLSDPSEIGAGMSVAMITTFYGALLANLVFLPMASKMKEQQGKVMKAREMVRDGILAIMQGDGPSMIENRLRLYLSDDASAEDSGEESTPLSKAA